MSIQHSRHNSRSTKKDFYLKPAPNGVQLSRSHQYYFQIQGQLAIQVVGIAILSDGRHKEFISKELNVTCMSLVACSHHVNCRND